MQNYTPNSHKYKAEQREIAAADKAAERLTGDRKIEKVVTGKAKVKKKSEIRKFTDVFISEDASKVKGYIFSDVLVPALKKLVSDIVKDGIEMILYGGTGYNRKSSGSNISYVSYDRYSRDDRRPASTTANRNRFDYGDIIFESRGEAEAVRTQMDEVIERYGFVTVADMYDMAGLTEPYTANKYGWTNIRSAEIVRVRDGYIIKLPRAAAID